jgi:Mg/Co/Ni transporter MgtE
MVLLVTMILEIPVLLMITGGSDSLCELIGRSRYHLLLGFLPLSSAVSGNVGLQASTLTTRAISHSHVTIDSYLSWLIREVGVSVCLGLGMGVVVGTIAYFASSQDLAFGITIMIAQFVSIVTAGMTGTLAPLLCSFIFKRDFGKWIGTLETAVQDVVGSFAMIILSYHILVLLASGDVDPSDRCVVTDK